MHSIEQYNRNSIQLKQSKQCNRPQKKNLLNYTFLIKQKCNLLCDFTVSSSSTMVNSSNIFRTFTQIFIFRIQLTWYGDDKFFTLTIFRVLYHNTIQLNFYKIAFKQLKETVMAICFLSFSYFLVLNENERYNEYWTS